MDYLYHLNSQFFGLAQIIIGLFGFLILLAVMVFLLFYVYYGPSDDMWDSSQTRYQMRKEFEENLRWYKITTWSTWPPYASVPYLIAVVLLSLWGLIAWSIYAYEVTNDTTSLYSSGKTRLTQPFEEYLVMRDKEDGKNIEVIKSTELKRFTIVKIDPPKHVYVDLKSENGQLYERVYVGKHCSNLPKVHDEYNIFITTYHMKDDPSVLKYRFNDLRSTFCGA